MRRLFILLVMVVGALLIGSESDVRAQSGGQIEIGQTVTGDLQSTAGDRWILAGTAGDVIEIRLDSTAFDPYVEFISPDGTVLVSDDDGGEGTNARLRYALMTTGSFTIVARSFHSGSGLYTLTIASFEQPQGQTLAYGETKAAFLSNRPDGDHWTFSAGEGDMIALTAYSLDFVPVVNVYESGAEFSFETYVAEPESQFIIMLHAGEYDLQVLGGTGTYSLSIERLERPTDWTLEYGDTVESYLGGEYQHDEWIFHGEADRPLYLSWRGVSMTASVHLYAPDGSEVGDPLYFLGSLLTWLPVTGDYRVVIEPADLSTSGHYTLSANDASIQPLVGTVEGNTRQADILWTFEGQAGEIVMLDLMTGTPTDFDLELYAPDGTLVAKDEALGDGQSPKVLTHLPVFGLYTVTIVDWRYGALYNDYDLTLTRFARPITDQIAYGDQVSSILEQGSEVWHFTGAEGDIVRIVLDTETFDPEITLTDADGQSIGAVHPDMHQVQSLLLATLPADGDYTITVNNPEDLGHYLLYLDTIGDQRLENGQTIATRLVQPYGDFWLFEGQAGEIAHVNMEAVQSFYPEVYLFSVEGERLSQGHFLNDSLNLDTALPSTGTYVVLVHLEMSMLTRHFEQQGHYQLMFEIEGR